MSILNVNKINPVGSGSTVTIAGIASVTSNLSAIDITSTNISVGSSVTTNEFYGDQIKLGDNKKILLGEGNDIEIYHTGAVDMIESKSLYLIQEAQNHIFRNLAGDEAYAKFFGNGAVELYHNGTKQVETSANGLKISAAGKGIDYTAQTASSLSGVSVSSELLDHYEEGTFTPTFGASNGSSTAGYSTQSGKYTRIGNIVHVQIRITLSSLSTNSHSHAWISGLPIASAERTATSSIICGGMQNSGYNSFPIAGRTEAGSTRIELFQATNGGVTDFSTSTVSGTAFFILQCTYRAN